MEDNTTKDFKAIYGENYMRLTQEVGTVVFLKKDGTIRIMLATRNPKTIDLLHEDSSWQLSGHDKRCNINNGNIAVFDLILGEARSFNIERMVAVEYYGTMYGMEEYEKIRESFKAFKQAYEARMPKTLSMDLLD